MKISRPTIVTSTAHFALAAVFLGVALTLFTFVMYGVVNARSQAVSSSQALQGRLEQAQALQQGATIANTTKEERAALTTLPVPPDGGAAFIAGIESLGKTARVAATISSVTAQAPQGEVPGKLILSVHFQGSFAASMRYLKLIETAHAALTVPTISLDYNAADKSWGGTLTISALSFDTP